MIRHFHFYDLKTGRLTGGRISTQTEETAQANCPAGCGMVEGVKDPESERVDLSTGKLVPA